MSDEPFIDELMALINRHSMENGSNTPDYMLARFLCQCLAAFDSTVRLRESWYGRDPSRGPAFSGRTAKPGGAT